MDAETLGLASALADLGIYKLADLIEHARGGVLNELVLTAVEQQNLEQRAAEAVTLQSSVACRRAAQLAHADARAAEAERKQAEAEAKSAAAEAFGPVSLSLQIHPQLQRGGMVNARTQTPVMHQEQRCASTQAPSPEMVAAVAEQDRKKQQQLKAEADQSARERARELCQPVLARAISKAEAAERVVSQRQLDAHKAIEAARLLAERKAREAAAAAADRAEASEHRAAATREREQMARQQVEESILRAELWSLEEEKVDFVDIQVGLLGMLQEARRSCMHCSEA